VGTGAPKISNIGHFYVVVCGYKNVSDRRRYVNTSRFCQNVWRSRDPQGLYRIGGHYVATIIVVTCLVYVFMYVCIYLFYYVLFIYYNFVLKVQKQYVKKCYNKNISKHTTTSQNAEHQSHKKCLPNRPIRPSLTINNSHAICDLLHNSGSLSPLQAELIIETLKLKLVKPQTLHPSLQNWILRPNTENIWLYVIPWHATSLITALLELKHVRIKFNERLHTKSYKGVPSLKTFRTSELQLTRHVVDFLLKLNIVILVCE